MPIHAMLLYKFVSLFVVGIYDVTMVTVEQHLYQTIVLPRKLTTGGIHDYLVCYCPLVGILFEVLRIVV